MKTQNSKRSKTQCKTTVPTTRSQPLPENWPSEITYLEAPCYSLVVQQDPQFLARLRCRKAGLMRPPSYNQTVPFIIPSIGSTTYLRVHIHPITTPSHPACNQHGLFATCDLSPSSFILPYFGLVHNTSAEDTDESSDYDLSLDRDIGVAVDAQTMGNEARFINDYRGVRKEGPNAEFRDVWVEVGNGSGGRGGEDVMVEKGIGVFVLSAGRSGKRSKGIMKGEEILVSYGKGFWSGRNGGLKEVETVEG